MDREVYEFGTFCVDATARRLTRDGVDVPLQPKPFELLLLLLRHAGEAVSREEIWHQLWPDVAVTDASLRQIVLKVREAVGSGLVQTVARHGFRWAGTLGQAKIENTPRDALPFERDAFVGRTAELATLEALLTGVDRLVTLTGPGGAGKTRLVLHFARSLTERLAGRLYFCDLSEARDAAQMRQVLAATLGIGLGEPDPDLRLIDALRGRGECLVILDNLEQLLAHAAVVGRWLDGTERARFLVTSRVVTGLSGERVLSLRPLDDDESLALFEARARCARQDFVLDETNRLAALSAVRLLDGLPLAIELAAARTRVLTPPTLLLRLQDRFAVLESSGERPSRQRTLRATLDWSWELLSEDERSALSQLSVFEGGFTLEGAEAVLVLSSEIWGMDAVQALVDHSMLYHASADRFGMLTSIALYASAREGTREIRAEAEARHGAYYATFGRDAERARPHQEWKQWWQTVRKELGNVVSACRRAVSRRDTAVAVDTLATAVTVLQKTGPFSIGVDLCEAIYSCMLSPTDRSRVELLHASILRSAGRPKETLALIESALATYRALGDRSCEAASLSSLGITLVALGRPVEARSCFEQTLAATRELGERLREGIALANLAVTYFYQHDLEQARTLFEAALVLHRETHNNESERLVLRNLGNLHAKQKRYEEARLMLEAALLEERAAGDNAGEGTVLNSLAALTAECRLFDESHALFEAALAIHSEVGDRDSRALALGNLAALSYMQGRNTQALGYFTEALALSRQIGDRIEEGRLLANLGVVAHEDGRLDEARAHFEEALALQQAAENRRAQGITLGQLGSVHRDQGRIDEARQCYREASARHQEFGTRHYEAIVSVHAARLEAMEGDRAAAFALLDRGEILFTELSDQEHLVWIEAIRAEVHWRHGDIDAASVTWSAVEAAAPVKSALIDREITRVRGLIQRG